jgi:hypothetical protein
MYSNKNPSLKYMKKAAIYKNSTGSLTFDPSQIKAVSYNWWTFVAKVDGLVVFNNYRYSVSTSKQQSAVRSLMKDLGIKIDLELPLSKGINSSNLSDLIVTAEEQLCDSFLADILKKQDRYERTKRQKLVKKLTDYLETDACFRDYEIKELNRFGHVNTIAVHQVVEAASLERDVENALHSFHRDGFGSVVFYV